MGSHRALPWAFQARAPLFSPYKTEKELSAARGMTILQSRSGNTETTEKIIGQRKISNHKLRVVGTFQKRMNLADVAIKQQPSKFIHSKRW